MMLAKKDLRLISYFFNDFWELELMTTAFYIKVSILLCDTGYFSVQSLCKVEIRDSSKNESYRVEKKLES